VAIPSPAAGGVARAWGGLDGRRAYYSAATEASRARGLGRARGHGLLLLLRPPLAGEVVPSRVPVVQQFLALAFLFLFPSVSLLWSW
jgi:hypothetical protein